MIERKNKQPWLLGTSVWCITVPKLKGPRHDVHTLATNSCREVAN
ncbi:hypothetical protein HanRHA438_Chr11g0489591 [Helianthus annuus]|nr:hypothetical protein HanRHA438_Chr11g0489591 [Helianthus annuus]